MVPLGGQMSFAEIAKRTGFAEGIVARFMRDAVCRHIFCETETGFIRHTKTSKALREPWFLGFLKAGAEEGWGIMLKVRWRLGARSSFRNSWGNADVCCL